MTDRTHFGYQDVAREAKAGLVRDVFDNVAGRYDLMNDLMSAGVHRRWKDAALDWLAPQPHQHLLDVAGGTGDIAFRFLERGGGAVTVCDINEKMLAEGRRRANDQLLGDKAKWLVGDAERLPIPDRSVDVYSIAFGLRNVTNIKLALAEAFRVLKIGGRFLCLEFSHVENAALAKVYEQFSFSVLPALGARVTGDREAYQYLVESIRRFPNQQDLGDKLQAQGFENITVRNLSAGIAAMHSGWRL